ncbi:MAG: helix-turn-helix domain-containing protein [Actinomycetota bacterium]|nr:helix-turn-helix domain-containing protein [Actinomycetota bacterium]
MASELERIVDSLGEALQRSVAVDDRKLRLLAYSPHYGPVDDTRLGSILRRRPPEESVRWVFSQGVQNATGPVSLPGNEGLAMLPRLCVPIIYRQTKLGFLWLIEGDVPLTAEQLSEAQRAADAAALVMYRESLVSELERGREREFLRDLLSDTASLRSSAAGALVDADLFVPGTVVVAVLRPTAGPAMPADVQTAVDLALSQARRHAPLRRALHLARPDHGVLLLATEVGRGPSVSPAQLGERLRVAFLEHLPGGEGGRCVVGVGEPQTHLAEAHVSYRQASQAAHIAEILPVMGEVVRWADLGIYRTLAQLPAEVLTAEALHPGLLILLQEDTGDVMLATLECFLDLAGDVKAAAAQLSIHRTSLYYRLGRIEEKAGVDLSRGGDRLALHLGLKMARMAGLYPRTPGTGD